MSGYLRRLVQRSARATPDIRSTARLPFAPFFTRDNRESIIENIGKETITPRETISGPQSNRVVESNQVDDLSLSPDQMIFESERPQSIDYSETNVARHSRSVVQAVSEPESSGHLSQEHLRPVLTLTEVPDSQSPAHFVREIVSDFNPLVTTAARIDESVEGHSGAWAADKTAPEYIGSDAPSRKFSARIRNQPMRHLEPKATETNEVHVTIGRIEITAVHVPQPTKPPLPPVKKPVSLDEYLAKRNGSPS